MWIKFDKNDESTFPKCSGIYQITYKEMMVAHPAIRGTDLDLFGKHLMMYCNWDSDKRKWTSSSPLVGEVLAYNPVRLELNDEPWIGEN